MKQMLQKDRLYGHAPDLAHIDFVPFLQGFGAKQHIARHAFLSLSSLAECCLMLMEQDGLPSKAGRTHKVLSALQKKHLCLVKEQSPKLTQAKLIEVATKQFGITPSMSQINRMLLSKEQFLRMREEDGDRKRNRGAKWPELEDALDNWYTMVISAPPRVSKSPSQL